MKKYNWEEDRFYSISENEERLYSTGDSELDDMLEKAFCDGYEYAQREFANLSQLKNKAIGAIRHVKRDFVVGKAAGKVMAGSNLTAQETHRVAVNARAQSIGANAKNAPEKFVKVAEATKMTPEALKQNASTWEMIDRNGTGATSLGGRYI